MALITWKPIEPPFTLKDKKVVSPWLPACDIAGTGSYLRLKAAGYWTPFAGLGPCGPDGLPGQPFPSERLLVADCPVGALIGMVGGSSASLKAAAPATGGIETRFFPVGSYTIFKLPEDSVGPLFIGFNILLRPLHIDELDITIDSGSTV